MKAKKAAKGLKKAQSLLSAVAEKWTEIRPDAQQLLAAAETSIKRALLLMDTKKSAAAGAKATGMRETNPGRAKRSTRKSLTDEARRKMSIAAKKRWAAVRRQDAKSLAG